MQGMEKKSLKLPLCHSLTFRFGQVDEFFYNILNAHFTLLIT